ncbi:MAG TPA: hypothetical protein VLE70_20350 [Anaerolineae bacterium]|jgi:hypothetical protein|nr:hypothetical protein [Anaerolineae bacterium]
MMGVKLVDGVKSFLLDLRHRSLVDMALADAALVSGLAAGLVGLVVSFGLKGLIPARPLGDPLPLILSVTQLTRGFLYFQWQPPLLHLLFTLFLGLLAVVALRFIARRMPIREQAVRAGRIAALVNVGVVTLMAVDALMVGFWYLVAGVVTILLTGFAAGLAVTIWSRVHSDSSNEY